MFFRFVKALLLLPFPVVVLVPGAIVWANAGGSAAARLAGPGQALFWAALVCAAAGLVLAASTMRNFARVGKGTPAPWDPTTRLIVRGPYRRVRNPMITGVFLMLAAEALMLQSWPVAVWLGLFVLANAIYLPLSEEKGLEKRFGDDYRRYKANVPRWLPRLTPWRGDGADTSE